MIAETPPTVDVRDDLERSVRALHDDAWARHEATKAELARIAQAASLLGVHLDMVRPFAAARPWASAPTRAVDRRPSVADAHLLHAQMCGCLNDSAECCFTSCPCHDDPPGDVEPDPTADAHLRHRQGGIIPKPGQVLIGVDGPQVIIPLARHLIPTRDGEDEVPDWFLPHFTDRIPTQAEADEAAATEHDPAPEESVAGAAPTHLDDRARAVADTAGEILDPIHDATDAPRHECRWCDFHSTRKQAVGSHESSQHPKERAAEKARREHEATRPARAAAQMAEDLANYRGPVLACHDSECLWLVPVAKTGALDQLATHTLSEHGRAPSRRERTPQERP